MALLLSCIGTKLSPFFVDLVIAFDQAVYIFNETEGSFQVCISLETNTVVDNVTVEVQSTSDGSAMGK